MNVRIGATLLALSALPAFAGESARSAKDALDPDQASAKDALRPALLSAKDAFSPSAKSPKGAKDALFPPVHDTRWILGGGLSWRHIGEVEFDTGGTNLTIPNFFAASNTPVPGIGAPTGPASRTYNDGFVGPDSRTPGIGRTTDYAYQNPSQIQDNTLVYSATGGERRDVARTTSAAATSWSEDRDWELSPYLKLSRLTDAGNGWSAGPVVHFSFTNIERSRRGLNTILGREQRDIFDVSATDTYDASGLALPAAPYTGGPDIIGPLLPAVPSNRTLTDTLRSTDVVMWNDSITESLDVDLWGFSLGGEAVYQIQDKGYLAIGAGLVLNVADWEAKRSDTLYQQLNNAPPVAISSTSAKSSGTDLLLGLYFNAAAGYQLTETFSVEANIRYDINQSLADSVGNSSFDLDLKGFSIGLGANYTFW